ncbi:hypothetical protein I601_1014 [Nocardioides dokdonensis FR1436]|uniref:Mycothiol-dependent maleylpyruvate isomerase metal-binding domain-containing protein n=1 Tax=Nocardioides dokdonensis FR1436 TaxID=1300347 RepID=A0A1A9GHB3_9ACTN|nr:maleylpyruvate isomerase family mycothiol-dependent enzyme [Nocardioides dokdonensis]ANH37456.1 hypothetical protein I601_1014 [Nocardioides dokdonensis FR1436]
MDSPDDRELLTGYTDTWWQAVQDFTALLEDLDEAEWDAPTDLAGWDVRAVASHVAHLESVLATGVEEHAEVGEPAHARGLMNLYTEIGVVNRRGASPTAIIDEIRSATTTRRTALQAEPPTDAAGKPERVFGGVPWSWGLLLRNRPLDVWMHEQDVRRATGRPGGLDSVQAQHTIDYLAESMGYVLAKRAGAPVGTSLSVHVAGCEPVSVEVGDDGRGHALPGPPASPTVTLHLDRDSFVRLAGGRCDAEPGAVRVEGDQELGQRVLAAMATTP